MKLITAVIQPTKLGILREALIDEGIQGMTITEVKGMGQQRGKTELYRGNEYAVHFLTKIKVEIALEDVLVDKIIDVISKTCCDGKVGDGKIFIVPLDDVVRIRTGERGSGAI